jgi:predicted lipoprotein with Yx(FWY)xxD motif
MVRGLRVASAILAATLVSSCASMAPSGGPGATQQTSIGPVYTDAKGMTLYTYDGDLPFVSHCAGLCALAWPPLEAADGDRPKGDFSIITRASGAKQWAYKNKPLYTYFWDSKPGDVTGDGEDGTWHAAKP